MANVEIIKTTGSHIDHVARNMREADRIEIEASGGFLPIEALEQGYNRSSSCWTAVIDHEPSVIFGVCPISVFHGTGSPWLLGTDKVSKIKRTFLKESQSYVDLMLKYYPILMNYVDTRNKRSIRWLKWLGFTIHEPIKYGMNGELFHLFERRADNV